MRITEVSDSIGNPGALTDFQVLVDDNTNFGKIIYNDGSIDYIGEYSYENNEYKLTYKLIALNPGFYLFTHFSFTYPLGKDQDFEGRCSRIYSDAVVNLNNGADNNVSMLSASPNALYNTLILADPNARFHKFGGYCFYVKE